MLYHYTDETGLKGIFLKSNPDIQNEIHIRFSTASRFSDKTEGKHAIELFHEVCRAFFADKKSNKELYEATQKISLQEEAFVMHAGDINSAPTDILPLKAPIVIDFGRVKTFIACFSENEDNQALWHLDGKQNIFAIEFFDPNHFQHWLPDGNSNNTPFYVHFEKVIYDDISKKQRIEEDLHESYQLYRNNRKKFRNSLKQSISEYQYIFKNEQYHPENETRAIIKVKRLSDLRRFGISPFVDKKGKYFHFPMNEIFVASIRIRSDVADADVAALAAIVKECVPNTTVVYKGRSI